jgi:hypothetical protein
MSRKDVAIKLVKQNGAQLKKLTSQLKGDKDVVLAAISSNSISMEQCLLYANDTLRSNKDFIMELLKIDVNKGYAFCDGILKSDDDVIKVVLDYFCNKKK